MSDVCDAPEWSPLLRRGEFAVHFLVSDGINDERGKPVYAVGVCFRPAQAPVVMTFETAALVKEFCLEMRPTGIRVNNNSAADLCFPQRGNEPGAMHVH